MSKLLVGCSIGQEVEMESHTPHLCAPRSWNLAAHFEVTASGSRLCYWRNDVVLKAVVFQVEH